MLPSVLAGLGLGFSLIVAIGAQNMFVLRQGLRREHVLVVALICALSDVSLIALGVSGIGLALEHTPGLVEVVRWVGAAFLLLYAGMAAWRALRGPAEALVVQEEGTSIPVAAGQVSGSDARVGLATRQTVAPPRKATGRGVVVLTCLALTWLNPHVYLDTVLLVGSIANAQDAGAWAFGAGAMAASCIWFFALAYGARLLGRWLATPRAWRILDGVIAVVMVAVAINLVIGA